MKLHRPGPLARRRGRPPEESFFTRAFPPLGRGGAAMNLPGLSIAFEGMDDRWRDAFLEGYRPYAVDSSPPRAGADLTLLASRSEVEHYIPPPPAGVQELNPVFVVVEPETAHRGHWKVRACTYDLAASFSTAKRRGGAVFSSMPIDSRERSVENILRVVTAWLALARGGLLIHSASIVKDAKAYLFFGRSGAGKSTLAESSRRGQVVSDDLTLILPSQRESGKLAVVGSPYRGTYTAGEPYQGRAAIAAAFRLEKAPAGRTPAVAPLATGPAMADAISNLPFVVDQLHASEDLFPAVERALRCLPIFSLRFRKDDDSFWEAIEAAGL